jgi:PucR family transcriptional regulator, purine catabolism regulatory protein
MDSESRVTLNDVVKLALPLNTYTLAETDARSHAINWLYILTDPHNIRDQIQIGDLVVLPPLLQTQLSETALHELIQELGNSTGACLLVMHDVPDTAVALANSLDLPLIRLPDDSSLREVQRNVSALLLDRQAQVTERGMQLYRQLSEMSREDQGLNSMTDLMSKMTGKIVVVQDKRLEIKAISIPPNNHLNIAQLSEALQQRDQLPMALLNRKAAAKLRQSHWQQIMPGLNVARLLTPIISGDRARGYLSVIGLADDLDLLDKLTAEHGAAACALEMAKAKAVSEAKKELRGDFLEGVLAGKLPRAEMERLQARLDHDTEQPHAIITLQLEGQNANITRHLETAVNWIISSHNRPALVHVYGGITVCVFQALRNMEEDMGTAHELERRLREYLHNEPDFKDMRLLAGMSGPAVTLTEWPEYYQNAVQAMKLAERLKLNTLVDYASLGVYQLLTQLDGIPAVHTFSQQVIGPLAEYDKRHRSNLVNTMAAYFDHHGNISQTAESLFIHRNTLLYRLERISELTGHDLNQADMRLSLHLALKLWQLRPENS